MKRKKTLLAESEISELVFSDEKLKINKVGDECIFEIGTEITTDLAEAVTIMMRVCDNRNKIWDLKIEGNIENIIPAKSLFWLTGGHNEWRNMEHYSKPWCECYLEYQEEFGFLIINSVNRSKTFGEIRNYFIKYLNLPVLYEFSISKKLIK